MKITIVGAGIGGLSCALSLHAAGFRDIDIYESVAAVKEIGVGVNLLPHAVRELDELGLLAELYQVAIATADLSYMTRRGQLVWHEKRGLGAGYQWPQFSIHRGSLLGIIYRAVLERLGEDRIHVGHQLIRCGTHKGNCAWGEFRRGDAAIPVSTESDLLIACDGVHSTVRAQYHPNEGAPIWNGTTMWRGTTVTAPLLGGDNMIVAGSFAHRIVVYPISRHHAEQGQALINWVAEKRVDENQPMPKQDWEHTVDVAEVLSLFSSFEFPFLSMTSLIKNAQAIYQYPMVDRNPLPSWLQERVVLLGDAAHPMYPVGSNGASQAIIDARTIAFELASSNIIEDALKTYDATRRPATAAIVAANRAVGPEKCIDIVEERAPQGFTNIEDVISEAELIGIAESYKRTAGFDPSVLNERASLSVPSH